MNLARSNRMKYVKDCLLYILLLISVVLCSTAVMKVLDLVFKIGYENIWTIGYKVGFVAWLLLSVASIIRKRKNWSTHKLSICFLTCKGWPPIFGSHPSFCAYTAPDSTFPVVRGKRRWPGPFRLPFPPAFGRFGMDPVTVGEPNGVGSGNSYIFFEFSLHCI